MTTHHSCGSRCTKQYAAIKQHEIVVMVVLVSYERRFSSLRGDVDMATVLLGAQINASASSAWKGSDSSSPHHFVAHRRHLTSATISLPLSLSIFLVVKPQPAMVDEQSQLDVQWRVKHPAQTRW